MFWSHPLTFVNAQVVTPNGRLAKTLRVKRGRIDGIDVAPDSGDHIIDLDRSFVLPGLINAHEHLELNSQPRLKWREKYANASEWIADFQRSLPGAYDEILDVFASPSGDRVVARWNCTGLNNGVFGLPADGRRIAFSGISIWTVRDGRLAECWVERSSPQ